MKNWKLLNNFSQNRESNPLIAFVYEASFTNSDGVLMMADSWG